MLLLILPPILVVVALAVLILLFARRLPSIEDIARRRADTFAPLLPFRDRMKRWGLSLVERFARSIKVVSLRIHNRLNVLATQAHSARVKVTERIAERKKTTSVSSGDSSFPARTPDTSSSGVSATSETVDASASEKMGGSSLSSDEAMNETRAERDRSNRLRRWFGSKSGKETNDVSNASRFNSTEILSDESLPPLVSEPLEPSEDARREKEREREVRHRAADIGRRIGNAVARIRPERTVPVFPAVSLEVPSRKDQMEDILVERISMNPRDIEAYERLGDYYLEQKNLVDAKECYRQVLKLSPAYRLVKIKIRRLERLLEKERVS